MTENDFDSAINPYGSPDASSFTADGHGGDPNLSRTALMLRRTKPWVRFMSICSFILAALCVIATFGMSWAGEFPNQGSIPVLGLIIAFYLVFATFCACAGAYLWQYANRIQKFLVYQTVEMLDPALASQKSFWKLVGISTLIFVVVYVVAIVGMVVIVGQAVEQAAP